MADVLNALKGNTHKALDRAFHSASKADIAGLFFKIAEKKGGWSPLHLVDGVFQDGLTIKPGTLSDFWPDIQELKAQGLVNVRDLANKNMLIEPTAALIKLVRKHIS